MSVLAMSTALWSKIDAYYVTLITAWCAKYVDLAGATVKVAEQFDPDGVAYPFVLIRAYECKTGEAQPLFGDGLYHLDGIMYPYEFVVIKPFETMEEAKNFASNAHGSLIGELALDPTLGGLAADDGEYVKQFEFDEGELYIRGMAGQQPEGKFAGTACVRINVMTER